MISGVQSDPLAALSHEMRNLIATFVGFSELLLSQDWPPDKQREYLETMRDEGVRVSQFLSELLDLQRMEAGVSAPKKRPIDLAALLKFAAEVAGHDPKHPIELELQPDLPMALAEPDRIQQVLANLLSNARKYSPRGGTIHVTARATKDAIEVSVGDPGIGIPPESLGRVFDKFFRVESLAHRDIRGTGLGLAICREIVEAHGGSIRAESAGLGQGALVTFSLPFSRARTRPRPRKTSSAAAPLSSRGEHLTPHQRNGRHPSCVSRPAAAQSPRGARAGFPSRDSSPTD